MTTRTIAHPQIVSRDEWLTARKALLAKEKDLTRRRDALNAERRRLPMVRIDKEYVFEGLNGNASLLDLFDGRRQLIVYHFMFDPSWDEGCSFVVDNIGHLVHLHARDTSLVLVSRAPLAKLEPFKGRMGWTAPWYSSFGSDFNYDFHVTQVAKGATHFARGESHGLSVFLRVGDSVFHTYSAYARWVEPLDGTYQYLDLTALGRQEDWEDSPEGWPQSPTYGWLRHHDKYGHDAKGSEAEP